MEILFVDKGNTFARHEMNCVVLVGWVWFFCCITPVGYVCGRISLGTKLVKAITVKKIFWLIQKYPKTKKNIIPIIGLFLYKKASKSSFLKHQSCFKKIVSLKLIMFLASNFKPFIILYFLLSNMLKQKETIQCICGCVLVV